MFLNLTRHDQSSSAAQELWRIKKDSLGRALRLLTIAVALSTGVGCACRSYDIALIPESDMNRRLSAVRVDVVWTTPEDSSELRNASSRDWFLGEDPLCRQRRFEGRVATTEVSLQDIGGDALSVDNGKFVPPRGRDVDGFVVFALYAGMDQLGKDALTAFYDSEQGRTATAVVKSCKFKILLQSARIALHAEAKKGFLR